MTPLDFKYIAEQKKDWSRRTFLGKMAQGVGALALGSLINPRLIAGTSSDTWRGILPSPQFLPKAKRVIHLCMAGGPSHLDLFDYKPMLKKLDGQPFPESITRGQQLAQLQNSKLIARGTSFGFTRCGISGQMISDLLPNIQTIADDICVVRSLHTEQINHDPAHAFMNTGSNVKGRPSMGSWLLYGLGSETQNLPGYVVLMSTGPEADQPVSARQWSSGFLPSRFQGVQFQSKGSPVHYVGNPEGVCQSTQRQVIEEVQRLNSLQADQSLDPEVQTRITQYELAFKMQTSVPELTDMRDESQATLDLYGVKNAGDGSFASNCLLARRMAERGVRFIQLYHRGWDHHDGLDNKLKVAAGHCDRASAALIKDLKQRGMLEDTLVLWGGEFGRTPMGQGSGRDHHINAFSVWMAGGGIKPGISWGSTDELGYKYTDDEQAMHVHDLHATMLATFGIDHTKLIYRSQGRDFRLTDVQGKIAHGILV
ncbi:MAG: DUF1501 domain-containing protein [Verrucomicrobiota bacterium]|jgi:hypothetical protein|nr:MAG: DUF1501 domain-containing protein [Verrucomicrobiota bacterium]